MALRHALIDVGPLRSSRAYRRLWIGGVFSGLGGQLTLVAVMFQVWRATGSTVWTGAVGVAQAVPMIGVGLFAGALVDRVDRRRCYLVALVGQAACTALLAVQGLAGGVPTAAVVLLVAAQSCFVAVAGPAARTFIPRLLPPEQVAAGQALNRISFHGAMLVGPALAGVLIGWLGVGACYLIDAATFGLAFLGAFGLPPMRPEGEPSRPGVRGLADGFAFLARTPAVRGVLLTDLAATVLAMPVSLFPLINAERFGDDPRTLGLFLTALGVGGVVASALSGTFTRRARPGRVMLVGSITWGVALAAFAVAPGAWAGLACLALAGAADSVAVVARSTIVQLNTPDAMRGRLAAVEQMVGVAGPDLGNLRGGLVARATSGTVALLTGGLACVAAVAAVGVLTPGLRHAPTPVASPVPDRTPA
ncbi:MAG TPA: MFS transporter [Actinocatenispora sp.]